LNRPVRVGVVGAGSLGYHHIRILRDVRGAQLVGFHERSAERGGKVSAELGVPYFASLGDLVAASDAMTVVVPTPAHHSIAKVALEEGRHVLIEKPIAVSLDEADELVDLARSAGVVIQTGHVERFNRAIRAALPHVSSPRFVESNRLAPFNPRGSDVAVVLDLMIHDIDLVRTLVGGHVSNVEAVGVPVLTPFVDIANARLTFDSGAVANITASRVSKDRTRKLRMFQSNGYLSLDLAAGSGEFYRMRSGLDLETLSKEPRAIDDFVERIPLDAPDGEPLRLEFESFITAIRGEGPVVVTGEDGREALAVALGIVREIERNLPVLSDRAPAASA
jgi:predicted dehydrogenase